MMYWSLRRDRRYIRHIVPVICSFFRNAITLGLGRYFTRRQTRVAIVLIEHMGDIVAAEPIARLARRRFPDARIFWLARAPYVSLPASYPDVNRVVTMGCLTEWILLRRLKLFDVVWDLHINGRACPHCRIPEIKPGVLLGDQNYYDYGGLLDVACLSAGLPKMADGPVLAPAPAVAATVDALSLPPRFIAMHCVSNEGVRDWPADKWRELATRILAADPTVVLVEVGLRALVVQQNGARQRSLCGTLSILETAEVIRRAVLFIGIDSGPAHLANAVGTPGVILLGSYGSFRSHMPYSGGYATGEAADIVRADGPVAELPVASAFAAVMARLAGGKVAGMAALAGAPPPDPDAGRGAGT